MKKGALVMLDALGFKGIWNRPGLSGDAVVQKLRDLKTRVESSVAERADFLREFVDGVEVRPEDVHVEVAFLSDTIVVGVAGGSPTLSILGAALLSSEVIAEAASGQPAFALRGSLAYGEYLIDGNFIVGPAVDDAAGHMDLAEGAFAWLTPGAQRTRKRPFSLPGVLHPYAVPLKGGRVYRTAAIAPFVEMRTTARRDKREALCDAILATFSPGSIDIEIKRQNTATFLKRISKAVDEHNADEDGDAVQT